MLRRITYLVLLFLGTSAIAVGDESKTIRLLTIGNSFADNALKFLPGIVGATGNELIVAKANLGGCTMQRHWNHVEKYEADQDDKQGRPYGNGQASLRERLEQEAWDVVTIQQVSWQGHDPNTFRPYAAKLRDYIRKYAPPSEILLHQTWAYRIDDPRFTPANEGKEPHTQAVMYQQVRDAYHTIAKELNVGIIPSGDAMYLADTSKQWGYRPDAAFDFATAKPPSLPQQNHSLHVGWRWKKQKDGANKLQIDGHHASMAGEYLIGCVWYEVLFQQSVVDNEFIPAGLDAAYAQFLRNTAHEAVLRSKRDLETAAK